MKSEIDWILSVARLPQDDGRVTSYCLLQAPPLPLRDHFHEFAVEAFGVVVLLQIVVQRFALRNETEVQVLVVPVAVTHVGITENVKEVAHPGKLILARNLYVNAELVATYRQVVLGAEIEGVLDACLQQIGRTHV